MAVIQNKDIIQPALITRARYSFSVVEKRIIYRIIEMIQKYLAKEKLSAGFKIDINQFQDWDITLPTHVFLKDEKDKNYNSVRKNLLSLNNKVIEIKTDTTWEAYNIIERPKIKGIKKINSEGSFVSFRLAPAIVRGFFNYAKGFSKYELKVAFELESEYAMRFYELVSNQNNVPFLDYKIETLKEYFCIEDKYLNSDGTTHLGSFKRKILEVARKNLDAISPWTFTYDFLDCNRNIIDSKNKRTKRVYIRIYPKIQPQFRDVLLEKNELQKIVSLHWDLPKHLIDMLTQEYDFTMKEIKVHRALFKEAYEKIDVMAKLSYLRRYANASNNPKGYVISALRQDISELKEKDKINEVTQSLAMKKKV